MWTQCQHLQDNSSWDIFYDIGGALELDLKHWATASEACSKCKEITLWGHFASISHFGCIPLCSQCFHIHRVMRLTLQWRVQGTCWRGKTHGLLHRLRHLSRVEQHQQEQQATSNPTVLTGLLGHTFLEEDRAFEVIVIPIPLLCLRPLAMREEGSVSFCCFLPSILLYILCVHPCPFQCKL